MNWKNEWKILISFIAIFLLFYFLPVDTERFQTSIIESLALAKWYAQEHVLLCLLPAFFIAGAISVFINQNSVIQHLGSKANKILSYSVASISGSILAVCSCTVLPIFAGIYKMGAGIGPATTFLYSGPAINVLAIILTARVLGLEIGIARALGAIVFSIIIGLLMHLFFIKDEEARSKDIPQIPLTDNNETASLLQNTLFMFVLVAILVFANWGKTDNQTGFWYFIYSSRWIITSVFAVILGLMLIRWFNIQWFKIVYIVIPVIFAGICFPDIPVLAFSTAIIGLSIVLNTTKGKSEEWFNASWSFAKQILPLLFVGVLIAGLLLGRSGNNGLIPSEWIYTFVGGNSLQANLFASVVGTFMYFATLTEIPILEGLLKKGMGHGPALALLLAGPALSLPNILVIRSIIGNKKTITFVLLVIIMATVTGYIYGAYF